MKSGAIMVIQIIKTDKPLCDPAVRALRDKLRAGELVAAGTSSTVNVREVVKDAIEGVKRDGDKRVIDDTKQLHCSTFNAGMIRVPKPDIEKGRKDFEKEGPDALRMIRIMRKVISNVREYQERILIKAPPVLKRGSRELAVRYIPINRVAVYVPGAETALSSSVIMTVVPAQVAGVREIVMVTPPKDDGSIKPSILALADELGIKEIYRVSGVAGLAAVTFGTESIRPPVAKIVGPGSSFIAEAKRQLFGRVGIDSIAGPSEVFIIADESARADWVAADMLAQAEHDPGSAVLVTLSEKLADAVVAAIAEQLPKLKREEAIEAALKEYSAIIVVPDINAACETANDFAPEHLQIITDNDDAALAKIRNAGAIFLGPQTPVPLGDYYAGPSHVLPTGGAARFFGPLSANDFLKASSVVRYDAAALAQDADDVIAFAEREGLTAHARAIKIRTSKRGG